MKTINPTKQQQHPMTAPIHPAASAYEAQLRIRREGEERSAAQQDLNSWLGELSTQRSATHQHLPNSKQSTKAKVPTTSNTVEESSVAASFEDERVRGNNFFSKGKYLKAIQCYTQCLGWKEASTTPVVYSNRGKSQYAIVHIFLLDVHLTPYFQT